MLHALRVLVRFVLHVQALIWPFYRHRHAVEIRRDQCFTGVYPRHGKSRTKTLEGDPVLQQLTQTVCYSLAGQEAWILNKSALRLVFSPHFCESSFFKSQPCTEQLQAYGVQTMANLRLLPMRFPCHLYRFPEPCSYWYPHTSEQIHHTFGHGNMQQQPIRLRARCAYQQLAPETPQDI